MSVTLMPADKAIELDRQQRRNRRDQWILCGLIIAQVPVAAALRVWIPQATGLSQFQSMGYEVRIFPDKSVVLHREGQKDRAFHVLDDPDRNLGRAWWWAVKNEKGEAK